MEWVEGGSREGWAGTRVSQEKRNPEKEGERHRGAAKKLKGTEGHTCAETKMGEMKTWVRCPETKEVTAIVLMLSTYWVMACAVSGNPQHNPVKWCCSIPSLQSRKLRPREVTSLINVIQLAWTRIQVCIKRHIFTLTGIERDRGSRRERWKWEAGKENKVFGCVAPVARGLELNLGMAASRCVAFSKWCHPSGLRFLHVTKRKSIEDPLLWGCFMEDGRQHRWSY